jgi:hypothetical protein
MKSKLFNLTPNALNRPINQNHVDKLSKSMVKWGFLESQPIQVNSNRQITDGHHRYFAAKSLNIPYYFITVDENCDFEMMRDINMTQKHYNLYDWVSIYAAHGIETYVIAKSILDKYPSQEFSSIITILTKWKSAWKHGDAVLRDDYLLLLSYYDFFREHLSFKTSLRFVRALTTMFSFNPNELTKLKEKVFGIIKSGESQMYVIQFVKLLNKYRKENRIITYYKKNKLCLKYE